MDWSYVFITLLLIILGVTYVFAIIFFRRMYFLIVEIEARLIQIRNMMEEQANPDKQRKARSQVGGPGAANQGSYGARPGRV